MDSGEERKELRKAVLQEEEGDEEERAAAGVPEDTAQDAPKEEEDRMERSRQEDARSAQVTALLQTCSLPHDVSK